MHRHPSDFRGPYWGVRWARILEPSKHKCRRMQAEVFEGCLVCPWLGMRFSGAAEARVLCAELQILACRCVCMGLCACALRMSRVEALESDEAPCLVSKRWRVRMFECLVSKRWRTGPMLQNICKRRVTRCRCVTLQSLRRGSWCGSRSSGRGSSGQTSACLQWWPRGQGRWGRLAIVRQLRPESLDAEVLTTVVAHATMAPVSERSSVALESTTVWASHAHSVHFRASPVELLRFGVMSAVLFI